MRILRKDMRAGTVKVATQSLDDLWYLSQVLAPQDVVRSKTQRRIKDSPDRRSKGGQRKTIMLSVTVEKVQFDPQAKALRISGLISHGPEDLVSIGAHHTISVDCDTTITLAKKSLTKVDMDILNEAVKGSTRPKVIIVAMDDGEAAIGLVRESGTDINEISSNIGGKYDTTGRQARIKSFHKELSDMVSLSCRSNTVSTIIICGPGFAKGAFMDSFRQFAPDLAPMAIVEDTGQSGRAGIWEVLKRGSVHNALEKVSSAANTRLVEDILTQIGKDTGLATYGMEQVSAAVDSGACEWILATDEIFFAQRERIECLFKSVKSSRGNAHIVNRHEPAGEILASLGGLAAKLRYQH